MTSQIDPNSRSVNAAYYERKIRNASNTLSKKYYQIMGSIDHYFNGDQVFKVPKGTIFDTEVKAPDGKTICVPVRVEPKVYFATERTFLSWMSIAILLGGVSTTLVTYGSPTTMIASIGFFITALIVIIRSTIVYASRVVNIRQKKAVNYEDKLGPQLVTVFLILSILFSYFCNY